MNYLVTTMRLKRGFGSCCENRSGKTMIRKSCNSIYCLQKLWPAKTIAYQDYGLAKQITPLAGRYAHNKNNVLLSDTKFDRIDDIIAGVSAGFTLFMLVVFIALFGTIDTDFFTNFCVFFNITGI